MTKRTRWYVPHRENVIRIKEENQEEQDYETEYNTNSKNNKGRMVTA